MSWGIRMVDVVRAYRRWRRRRLALLAPSFAIALGANIWVALASDVAGWLKVVSVFIAVLITGLLGYFIVQTMVCDRVQAGGRRQLARLLRAQLGPYRGVAFVSLVLLSLLLVVPELFRNPKPSYVVRVPRRPPASAQFLAEPPTRFEQDPPPEAPQPLPDLVLATADRAAGRELASGGDPQIHPAIEQIPLALHFEERDIETFRFPEPLAEAAPSRRDPPGPEQDEMELPRFRPDPSKPLALQKEEDPEELRGILRRGLRDEGETESLPPPEVRFDLVLLDRNDWHGAGLALLADYPFGRDDSIRFSHLFIAASDHGDYVDTHHELSLKRTILTYTRRLLGFTRHTPLDIAVSAGVSSDFVGSPAGPAILDRDGRLSPYVAVDAALWQPGTFGVLVHGGYSVPLNLFGSSSGVTELAALVRVDISEKVSLHLGYLLLFTRFRDYDEKYQREHPTKQIKEELSGPFLGIDFRF